MNEQKMDALISGLTKGSGSNEVLPKHTGNIGNMGNTDNTCNTDNTTRIDNKVLKQRINSENSEIRFCTIVDSCIIQKIRCIAKREGLQIKEVVGAAFMKAIMTYETKHGKIDSDIQHRTENLF